MNLPPSLRLALVPIGVAIAHKGLTYLGDESDRLAAQIEAARAELAAAQRGDEQPATDGPDADEQADYSSNEQAATSSTATPAPRRRSRLASILGNAAAFGAGAYLAMRAQGWLQQRAAAELLHDIGTTPAAAPRPRIDLDELARAGGGHSAKCSGAYGEGPNPDCVLPGPHDGRPVFGE